MPRRPPPLPVAVPPVHPERDALIRAVGDHPDDPTPALVYADWQDEHGRPELAELIRVCCEYETLTGARHTARRAGLRARRKELCRHPGFGGLVQPEPANLLRGLIHAHALNLDTLRRVTPAALPRYWPFDTVIDLFLQLDTTAAFDRPLLDAIVEQPWLARVRVLMCDSTLPVVCRRLARSPHLGGLTEIHLYAGECSAAAFAGLLLARSARALTVCSVMNTAFPPGQFAAAIGRVVRAPRADRFTRLWMNTPTFDDATGKALLESPRLKKLEGLAVPGRKMSKETRAGLRARFGKTLELL